MNATANPAVTRTSGRGAYTRMLVVVMDSLALRSMRQSPALGVPPQLELPPDPMRSNATSAAISRLDPFGLVFVVGEFLAALLLQRCFFVNAQFCYDRQPNYRS